MPYGKNTPRHIATFHKRSIRNREGVPVFHSPSFALPPVVLGASAPLGLVLIVSLKPEPAAAAAARRALAPASCTDALASNGGAGGGGGGGGA